MLNMTNYCFSVAKSYLTLNNPMDCSMSGLRVPHHLLEFAQVHIHYIGLIIREMQIKTTMKYHLTIDRMSIIKSLQIINAKEGVEKREPSYTVGGNLIATMMNNMEVP